MRARKTYFLHPGTDWSLVAVETLAFPDKLEHRHEVALDTLVPVVQLEQSGTDTTLMVERDELVSQEWGVAPFHVHQLYDHLQVQ